VAATARLPRNQLAAAAANCHALKKKLVPNFHQGDPPVVEGAFHSNDSFRLLKAFHGFPLAGSAYFVAAAPFNTRMQGACVVCWGSHNTWPVHPPLCMSYEHTIMLNCQKKLLVREVAAAVQSLGSRGPGVPPPG
jgi:hypothetical protein